MKQNLKEFKLDNFDYHIVKVDIYDRTLNDNVANNKSHALTYYLVLDSNSLILDYKVVFNQIYITNITTSSHEITKIKNKSLITRKLLLDKLKFEHKYNNDNQKSKQYRLFDDEQLINEINNWSYHYDWNEITFQNIEYIIQGSNASGQGNGKGKFSFKFNNENVIFSFLFQSINFIKKLLSIYTWQSYKKQMDLVWEQLANNELNVIDFEDWLKYYDKLQIKDYIHRYKINNDKWKEIKNELDLKIKKFSNQSINLEKEVIKQRTLLKANVFKNIKVDNLSKYYFNINKDIDYQFAHIKPVYLIKQEYFNELDLDKKEKILNQISDYNNFLPLSPDMHNDYDHYKLYWNEDGKINFINNNQKLCSAVNEYKSINQQIITYEMKQYLNQYIQLLKSKNKIE